MERLKACLFSANLPLILDAYSEVTLQNLWYWLHFHSSTVFFIVALHKWKDFDFTVGLSSFKGRENETIDKAMHVMAWSNNCKSWEYSTYFKSVGLLCRAFFHIKNQRVSPTVWSSLWIFSSWNTVFSKI